MAGLEGKPAPVAGEKPGMPKAEALLGLLVLVSLLMRLMPTREAAPAEVPAGAEARETWN